MAMAKQQSVEGNTQIGGILGPDISETGGLDSSIGGRSVDLSGLGLGGIGGEGPLPPVTGPQIIEALPEKPPKEYPEVPNPYTNTTEPNAPITRYNRPVTPPSSLANILSLSKVSSERSYVKGSMRSIGDDYIVSMNTSDSMTIAVKFTGIAGVSFDPMNFNLSPLEQKIVTVHFDPAEFEKLQEGITAINTIVDVASVSIIEQPSEITIPAIPIPIQPPTRPQLPVQGPQPPVQVEEVVVWKKVADEGGSFTVGTNERVRYGADKRWVELMMSGLNKCNNGTFGDPAPYTVKTCQVAVLVPQQQQPVIQPIIEPPILIQQPIIQQGGGGGGGGTIRKEYNSDTGQFEFINTQVNQE